MVPSMKHRWPVCPSVRSAEPNGHPSHTRSRRALSWSRQPLASCDPSTPLSYHRVQGGCMEHLQFRLVLRNPMECEGDEGGEGSEGGVGVY